MPSVSGGSAIAGQPCELLQDGERLGLERVELQRVGSDRHGRRLPFACGSRRGPSRRQRHARRVNQSVNVILARRLVGLARQAYLQLDPATPPAWQPRQVEPSPRRPSGLRRVRRVGRPISCSAGPSCTWIPAACSGHPAGMAHQSRLRAGRGGRHEVHRGYARELDSVTGLLRRWRGTMPRAASRSTSPATAPGVPWPRWRPVACTNRGPRSRAAVVFSAPRVGDRRFAASYPVPLLRIEHRHDLIPHLPLPPSLAKLLGHGLIDPVIGGLDWLEPVPARCPRRADRVRPCRRAALRRRCAGPLSGPAGPVSAPVRADPAARARGGSPRARPGAG